MQKTLYTCDHCERVFGDTKHISLTFGIVSGIAFPPDKKTMRFNWEVRRKLTGKFLHFCNGTCVGRYFTNLMKDQNEHAKKPSSRKPGRA